MTSLEFRILQYIKEQCDMFPARPPYRHHVANRFAPEGTSPVLDSLWQRGFLARTSYGRKGSRRPFLITDKGRQVLTGELVA